MLNLYGPQGQIIESVNLNAVQPLYDPRCTHPNVIEVEDPLTTAYQCQDCKIGWLVKEKINGEKK